MASTLSKLPFSPEKIETLGLLTVSAALGDGYRAEIQKSAACTLRKKYRRWHAISFYPSATRAARITPTSRALLDHAPGHVGVYPAGGAETAHWGAPTLALHFFIDPQALQSPDGASLRLLRREDARDPALSALLGALYEEVRRPSPQTRARCDDLAAAIRDRLAERHAAPVGAPPPPLRIGRASYARILDAMCGRAAATASVEQLASLSGLSKSRFTRNFRAALGFSPHNMLIENRLELVKLAIFHGENSLADAALGAGFYDQAHMTNAFKKRVGLRPSEFLAWFRAT